MTRASKHSRPSSTPKAGQSLQDQLLATRLRMEQIKLEKLEAEHKPPMPEYTRWEDLPPPSPEDEARYYEDFKRIYHAVALDSPRQTTEEFEAKLARRKALTAKKKASIGEGRDQYSGEPRDDFHSQNPCPQVNLTRQPDGGAAALGLRGGGPLPDR